MRRESAYKSPELNGAAYNIINCLFKSKFVRLLSCPEYGPDLSHRASGGQRREN